MSKTYTLSYNRSKLSRRTFFLFVSKKRGDLAVYLFTGYFFSRTTKHKPVSLRTINCAHKTRRLLTYISHGFAYTYLWPHNGQLGTYKGIGIAKINSPWYKSKSSYSSSQAQIRKSGKCNIALKVGKGKGLFLLFLYSTSFLGYGEMYLTK